MAITNSFRTYLNRIVNSDIRRAIEFMGGSTAWNDSTTTTTAAVTGTATIGTLVVTGTTTSTGAIGGPRTVVSGQGAGPIALTAAQSGGLFLFDRAAGITYTLPTPVVGLTYDFIVTTTITSNAAIVDSGSASVFLKGSYQEYDQDTSRATAIRTGNGSTHVKISMNGGTTGGIAGTWLRFTCDSSTTWVVQGTMEATGAVATAFST